MAPSSDVRAGKAEALPGAERSVFDDVFEWASDAMVVVDAKGAILQLNGAAARLAQLGRRDLASRPLGDLMPAFAEEEARAPGLRRALLHRPDGERVEVEATVSELPQSRRLLVLRPGAAQAEEAGGQTALRQLQHFWDASRDLLAIISTKDGKPRLLNEAAWAKTLGYAPQTLYATRLVDLAHPEDLERTLALAGRLGKDGDVTGFENRYRHADGNWVWLSWNVVREGDLNYAIARDISDAITAKQALAQSERQFRLLVAGVVDYALYMLSPEGLVTNWNAGAQKIKGYRTEEVLGRHFSLFYTEADRAAELPKKALETAAAQGRYEAEAWRVRKDGSLFWANVIIDPIRDETGQLIGFAKITRDMTERREAQLELQRAQERLAQAQKLEAIGQLTGGVAHDFNNLLMVVGGQAELLRRRIGEAEPSVKRALEAIDMSVRRGQDLTRHLLAFARRQRLHPAPISFAPRAGPLQQLLATSVGSSIQVSVDLPDDLWPVEADVSELELALLNMAVNARDAMPGGGTITLSGENVTLAPGQCGGDFVALTMTDTGAGIPPDILDKVFEPFFTTKAVDKGTGLGLSQVYGFAQQSGGRINITSELGQGAQITLYLPRTEAGAKDAAAACGRDDATPSRSAYVLLVEDNPQVADVASRLLDQLGHRTRTVTSADDALSLLESGERPELVFSDVVMAGDLDGLDLARRIRERWPETPVLLATGYSEAAERMPKDEFPILAKPYDLQGLNRAVSAALRGAAPASVD
jgi:PAS domain S-box-containing protein